MPKTDYIQKYTGITALVTSYTALKTKDIAEGQQHLIEITKAIEMSNVRQERLLENIETANKEQVRLQEKANIKLDAVIENQINKFAFDKLVQEKRQLREELDDELKKQLSSCKQLAHVINNEIGQIDDNNLTKLEKYLKIKKLKEIIKFLSSESFEDITDKDYLQGTKKDIENAFKVAGEELSQQDIKDLDLIDDIEEVDENKIAHKLLKEIEERELITSEIRELSEKVNNKESLSSIEYKNIKNKIKFLYKKVSQS